ncbi:DEAD/DEAH box helicase [Methanogenium cariaci]|uniref:DEAD/DEAH box helicase n=1 Tax=Methanogenium cariaci TaxID=2197 RepID=UPI00078570D8|nr:DEAD/DEAH box helicase [Methanogenium cariaci]
MFGETYADVFFEKSMEKLTLPVSDLMVRDTPDAAFSAGRFVSADQFLLRLLHDQITAASTQGLIQSAANFKIIPLPPHQILAVNFVLDQFKPRALIADEVGLGKTIEAALIFEELKARNIAKRALIVAPSSLCLQWQDEMKSKFGEDFAIYDRDTIKTLQQLHGQETNIWKLTDTIITSIDYLKPRNMNEELGERTNENRMRHNTSVYEAAVHVGFDVVIIDEAHKLTKDESGNETARYRLGKALAEATPFMLLLSATPHQGDTAKFRNLLTLIDPYQFYKECDITPGQCPECHGPE